MDNYPLLDIFWTMLWFFLFIAWISLLISLMADIFRSKDLSGLAKALWMLLIIVTPLLGSLIYLIARGRGMAERSAKEHGRQEEAFRDYVREAAPNSGSSIADELAKLADLRDAGTITADEFETQKAKLLA